MAGNQDSEAYRHGRLQGRSASYQAAMKMNAEVAS